MCIRDRCHNEASDVLPASAALGHVKVMAGLGKDQFYWCNLCSAYTDERACKLAKECDQQLKSAPPNLNHIKNVKNMQRNEKHM